MQVKAVEHAFQTKQAEKQTLEKTLQESQKRATTVEQSARENQQRMQEANTQIELLQQRVQVADHRIEEAKSGANEVKQGSRKTESDPSWVVRRDEILFTDEELGRGGWAVVKVAKFRAIRVAAKCLYEQIVSNYNRLLFIREMNMASRIRHPNLLQFIGATLHGELIILTELMPTMCPTRA